MAPAPDVPVVKFVKFRANDRCLADPSLFQAVRDTAQGWHEKGLEAQYWGTSMQHANEFYWLLFWKSHAHAMAIKADPSYPAFIQDRDALATEPVYEVHTSFSGNPQRALEAPVVEADYYKMNSDVRPAAETQEMIRRILPVMESMQGFIASSVGITIEDESWGVYLCGWRSIEDHMRLGTLDEHKELVVLMEENMNGMAELFVAHVQFKLHSAYSSA